MNVLDAVVTKVLSEPKFNDEYVSKGVVWWEVVVEYNCYGSFSVRTLTFKTLSEATKVVEGYKFLT